MSNLLKNCLLIVLQIDEAILIPAWDYIKKILKGCSAYVPCDSLYGKRRIYV